MIVVAIIGILAAIAIPNFVDMQYRAKRSEVPLNIDGIKTAEISYEASFDMFVEQSLARPNATVNKQMRTWTTGSSFDTLGWVPDGNVRGSYQVITSVSSGLNFQAVGECDVDGDGVFAMVQADKTTNARLTTTPNVY
jgi:type IV pilus assembly protein PilA